MREYAGISELGPRSRTEAPVAKAFVGSSPTPRTIEAHPNFSNQTIVNYLLSRKNIKPATIERKSKLLKSLMKSVDINNADEVVSFINTCGWASGTKDLAIGAYRDYLDMLGLTSIKLPHIRREESYPFIPIETELEQLITATRLKTATFLRLLKEGALRPIEAWMLQWKDVDVPSKNVTVKPAKYSKPRRFKISEETQHVIGFT